MNNKYKVTCASLLLSASSAIAQGLNTELTVTHEVVPEEQAATRLRILPAVTLPDVTPGRLSAASNFAGGTLTPFFNRLQPADYLTSSTRYPWRGYAALGYGPVYNLAASAGYRFVEREDFALDGYLQFDGMSYKSHFTSFESIYPDKVGFHRNSALVGANTRWTPEGTSGELKASVFYQFSGYNFPILDLPTAIVTERDINANVVKLDAGWGARTGNVEYRISGEYNMIAFAHDEANNGGKLAGSVLWHAGEKSAWGIDLSASIVKSTILGHKGVIHIKPAYNLTTGKFKAQIGVDLDIKTGNVAYNKTVLFAPDVQLVWQPSSYFNIWGKVSGRIDDNNRALLYNEQPYLLSDFDAGFSRVYSADAGITVGPWRGASISVFGGHLTTKDWYMPAIVTGAMSAVNVKGFHGGLSFNYDYRQFLSVNAKAELAQSPDGKFTTGYAYWRDHARFNLTAQAIVRPITPLEISVGYQLRTHREKVLAIGSLNLRTISNLKAGVRYAFTPRISAFLTGENLLNCHWYLGPSVPSQGIMGMIGATYKF